MKLLFLTQVIDAEDAVLGFVPRWIEALAQRCERVRVVALEAGETAGMPENSDVRVVGRRGVVRRWMRYRRILREALREDGFDTVLAHMVPRYALVAEGPARSAGAGLFLWYTHKGVDARLIRAVRRVDLAFTASAESLRIEAPNRVVTGHGIDLEHFTLAGASARPARLLSVGRMTPAKDPLTILAALSILVSRGHDLHLDLVGAGLADGDAAYGRSVREQIELGGLGERVELHGAVPYREVPRHFARASVLVNASLTGSVDKVVLEAMASGRAVMTCNESFVGVLSACEGGGADYHFEAGNAGQLADRLEVLLERTPADVARVGLELRGIVERDHELEALMDRLVMEMEGAK